MINSDKQLKILVIRLSSFGDIILTFPFLKRLKDTFPNSLVYYVTKSFYQNLVELSPHIDKIIIYNDDLYFTRGLIRKIKFDYVFDLHKNFKSYFLTLFNKGRKYRYKKENFKKFLLIKFKINLFNNVIPVYQKYINTLRYFSENIDSSYPEIDLKFEKNPIIDPGYVLLAPSSKHYTKIYPAEYFIDIISKNKNKRYILVGDSSARDINICNFIARDNENVINLCNKTNFKQLANLIYNADYVICNDSGILHLAELLRKKVFVFFGSTVKEFGFYPVLNTTTIFENNNIKCRPCSKNGKEKCPKKHFKCMKEIQQNIL